MNKWFLIKYIITCYHLMTTMSRLDDINNIMYIGLYPKVRILLLIVWLLSGNGRRIEIDPMRKTSEVLGRKLLHLNRTHSIVPERNTLHCKDKVCKLTLYFTEYVNKIDVLYWVPLYWIMTFIFLLSHFVTILSRTAGEKLVFFTRSTIARREKSNHVKISRRGKIINNNLRTLKH